MKHTLRALLAISLLVGFYALAIGVVVGLATAAYVVARFDPRAASAIALPALLAAIVGYAVVTASVRPRQSAPAGLAVTSEEEPAIWAEVRALAAAIGTRPPDDIRLVTEVNAAVSEEASWLGLRGGTRRLYVGVPLLLALSVAEMRAVLAHELGHYSGRHTSLGPIVYRGKETIRRVLMLVGNQPVVGRLFAWYGRVYLLVAHSVARRQEFEADEWSAELAGVDATRSALEVMDPLEALWRHFLTGFATLGNDDGLRPSPILPGFIEMMDSPHVIDELAMATGDLHEERSPYDTHPLMSERIARLATTTRPEPMADIRSLSPSAATLERIEEAVFEKSDLRPVSWSDALHAEAARDLNASAHELARLVRKAGTPSPILDDAVRRLRQPRRLGLLDECPAEDERRAVSRLLGDVLALSIIEDKSATLDVDWLSRYRLSADFHLIDPWAQAQDAADHRDPARLAGWARDLGVDLAQPLDGREPPAEPEWARALAVQGLVAPATSWGSWYALVVTGAGMVVLPLSKQEQRDLTLRNGYFRLGWSEALTNILKRIDATPPERLLSHPLGLHFPWDAITRVELRTRPLSRLTGSRLVVKLDKARRQRFLVFSAFSTGRPWEAIAASLGDRFVVRGRAANDWPSRPLS